MKEDIAFNSYLAGLFDGEGTFHLLMGGPNKVISARASIQLRADDWRVLVDCRDRCGHIGTLQYRRSYNLSAPNPGVVWYIHRGDESQYLAQRLRNGTGLLAKKARDFEIWSTAVDLLAVHGGGSKTLVRAELEALRAELSATKLFDEQMAEGAKDILVIDPLRPQWAKEKKFLRATPAIRGEICKRYSQGGVTQVELAQEFGFNQTYISYIVNNHRQ